MNLIIKLAILILFQKTISQYVPIKNYHQPRQYTQGAYYLPFHNEEYSWTKSEDSNIRKPHRKKDNDYYISAEMDYGTKRLQCKCKCKRIYHTEPIQDYEQNDPCCQSSCDRKPDAADEIYTPSQYPGMTNNEIYTPSQYPGIYKPTQYPYTFYNEMYTRTPYAPMIYPTFDLSEIGKVFPWLTWGMTTTTKTEHNGEKYNKTRIDKEEVVTKFKKEETTTTNDKYRNITIKDRDSSTKKEDKDETTPTRDKDTPVSIDDRERSDKKNGKDETTPIRDRDRTVTIDDKDRSDKKDGEDVTTPIRDRDTPITIDDKDRSDKKDDKDQTTTKDDIKDKSVETTTATEPTISTVPYIVSENIVKLHHYFPKKKQCLRNNCLRKDTVRKIGRYYEEDLFERPTIASYLNGNWRRNNIPRFR